MNVLSLRDSRRIIEKRRKKLQRRLVRIQWEEQQPMLNVANVHYERSDKCFNPSCLSLIPCTRQKARRASEILETRPSGLCAVDFQDRL